jgi:hypothetical protein
VKHKITVHESSYIGSCSEYTIEHDGSDYSVLRALIAKSVEGISLAQYPVRVDITIEKIK